MLEVTLKVEDKGVVLTDDGKTERRGIHYTAKSSDDEDMTPVEILFLLELNKVLSPLMDMVAKKIAKELECFQFTKVDIAKMRRLKGRM